MLITIAAIAAPVSTGQAQGVKRQTLPITHDWGVATAQAERVFPGTRAWLLNCSRGEGGQGGWKWNYQGSGAGGWMQFMQGTYNSYVWAAYQETLRRGFKVKSMKLLSYYEPLGQALTAAYMRSIGVSGIHWAGSYTC